MSESSINMPEPSFEGGVLASESGRVLGPRIELLSGQQWRYIQRRYNITPRELEIAQLVCRGLGNEKIARRLKITQGTVKTHVRNLYRKLWVHNKISMLLRFIEDTCMPGEHTKFG